MCDIVQCYLTGLCIIIYFYITFIEQRKPITENNDDWEHTHDLNY